MLHDFCFYFIALCLMLLYRYIFKLEIMYGDLSEGKLNQLLLEQYT